MEFSDFADHPTLILDPSPASTTPPPTIVRATHPCNDPVICEHPTPTLVSLVRITQRLQPAIPLVVTLVRQLNIGMALRPGMAAVILVG